ncbi:MAG TPA: hypothetical protein VF220_05440 [Nitrososphaeraceae archaeon]
MIGFIILAVLGVGGIPVLPYTIEECPQYVDAIKYIFVVYVHIINAPANGLMRIGIPGQEGYRCAFHDISLLSYGFKQGEINLHDEFYVCIDDRDTGNMNCEMHRFVNAKNPEDINLTMKHLPPNK